MLQNGDTREIKYTRKKTKSAFREIFVARYIPILQYLKPNLVNLLTIASDTHAFDYFKLLSNLSYRTNQRYTGNASEHKSENM